MNFTRIGALVRRNIVITYRGLDPLIDVFYWPLYDILLWGFASTIIQAPSSQMIMLSGLVISQACVRANLDISLNFLNELWSRNVVGLFATPLTIHEWMVAAMLQGLFDSIFVCLFSSIAVYFFYGLNVFSIGWIFIPLFLLLLFSGWALGFISGGCLVYGGQKVQKLVWILGWFFVPFSALFYPLSALPGWALLIAKAIPMSYAFEGLRMYIMHGTIPWNLLFTSLFLCIFYLVSSIFFFKLMFKLSRSQGLARLESE